jgi:hypothetical protein
MFLNMGPPWTDQNTARNRRKEYSDKLMTALSIPATPLSSSTN